MKGWRSITLFLPEPIEDNILLALQEAGTLGVEVEEGSGRAGEERKAIAYFDREQDLRALSEALARLCGGLGVSAHDVVDGLWVERQEAARKPISVGRRFVVVPALDLLPPRASGSPGVSPGEPDRIVLVIPPTRAFGTGEHETTRQCLVWLEETPVDGKSVLDLGTGSGILAMAAARLGAARVVGIDNDPEAIGIARENLALNGFGGDGAPGPTLLLGDLSTASGSFDLIVANLFPGALEESAPALARVQSGAGLLIISGFAPGEAGGLAAAYEQAGYREVNRSTSGEWAALVLVREPAHARA